MVEHVFLLCLVMCKIPLCSTNCCIINEIFDTSCSRSRFQDKQGCVLLSAHMCRRGGISAPQWSGEIWEQPLLPSQGMKSIESAYTVFGCGETDRPAFLSASSARASWKETRLCSGLQDDGASPSSWWHPVDTRRRQPASSLTPSSTCTSRAWLEQRTWKGRDHHHW